MFTEKVLNTISKKLNKRQSSLRTEMLLIDEYRKLASVIFKDRNPIKNLPDEVNKSRRILDRLIYNKNKVTNQILRK